MFNITNPINSIKKAFGIQNTKDIEGLINNAVNTFYNKNTYHNAQNENEIYTNSVKIIADVIQNRYMISKTHNILSTAINYIIKEIIEIPILLQNKENNTIDNPLKSLFDDNKVSIYNKTFNDFLESFIREYLISGVVYLLVKRNNNRILSANIVPSNIVQIMPASNQQYISTSLITGYIITRFPPEIIATQRFQLHSSGEYYIADNDNDLILYATDIAFEDYNIPGCNINLSKSLLLGIAKELQMYDNAIMRNIILNNAGQGKSVVGLENISPDPVTALKYADNLEEFMNKSANNGKCKVLLQHSGIQKEYQTKINSLELGYKSIDYTIQNDQETASQKILSSFGLSLSLLHHDTQYAGNQKESLKQFYITTAFPLIKKIFNDYLKYWFFPYYNISIGEYNYNIDKLKVQVFMEELINSVNNISFITENEKRGMIGLDEIEEDDEKEDVIETEDDDEEEDVIEIKKALNFLKK